MPRSHHHGLLVSIKNSSGQTLYKSEEFKFLEKPISSDHGKDDHALQTLKSGGSEFHAIQFQTVAKYRQEDTLTASVAIDAAHHQEFLEELQRSLAVYALFATLISGLLGWIHVLTDCDIPQRLVLSSVQHLLPMSGAGQRSLKDSQFSLLFEIRVVDAPRHDDLCHPAVGRKDHQARGGH